MGSYSWDLDSHCSDRGAEGEGMGSQHCSIHPGSNLSGLQIQECSPDTANSKAEAEALCLGLDGWSLQVLI